MQRLALLLLFGAVGAFTTAPIGLRRRDTIVFAKRGASKRRRKRAVQRQPKADDPSPPSPQLQTELPFQGEADAEAMPLQAEAPPVVSVEAPPMVPVEAAAAPPPGSAEDEKPKLSFKLPPLPEELVTKTKAKTDVSRFPVPSEQPVSKETGAIPLPDFETLEQKKRKKKRKRIVEAPQKQSMRIARNDTEQLRRAIEVDPNADARDNIFVEKDVDLVAILLGEGADKFFGIESAYLQLGHAALLLGLLLAAFVVEPSFPLTNLPEVYRVFLKEGLAVIFVINIATTVLAVIEASKRKQPVWFWAPKTLLLGGVALNQLRTGTRGGDRKKQQQ
ncbi:hypothetical protein CTAYLR_003386 [Chrysophaeum taylorii]|uniref:Uncharacterized protein n=1 Tax=Chrysophaeum taylorii TaxID=2483200 RepID=A0AAD7UEM9_9STRA|nr:hypothetical protein CTAYLR_003386 [Chrysophaeum taylorii]